MLKAHSRHMRIDHLIADLTASEIDGDTGTDITGIEYDSREVHPGDLFVALTGGYVDGHDFLPAALRAGAVVAVVAESAKHTNTAGFQAIVRVPDTRATLATLATTFYGHPSASMTTIGVTGTDGKTTTSHLIDAMCQANGRRTGLIGTVEVRIGDDIDLHESRQTTPESLLVQRYLAQMRDASVDVATLEATSHGLVLHRLDGCDFDIGVVTNITREHLDFHGTVEQYRAAKGSLLSRVAEARTRGKMGVTVLNADDEGARAVESFADGTSVIRYSLDDTSGAHITALDVNLTPTESRFTLNTPGGDAAVRLHLPGRYNVANALAAASVGHALDFAPQEIATGLESLRFVPGRMETVDAGQPFAVIVDYAHTPEAIRSVVREIRRSHPRRVILVFGSAGERDVEKRAIQGAVAITDADYAVFTSEDPRFEDPERIIRDIADGAVQAGGRAGVDFDCIEDRRDAIATALQKAGPGDIVVLAGKGHERSMIYGGEKRPWHEANVARELLHQMGYGQPSTRSKHE
jgi:UDP-N-acetylmuramoyl-L-alanyl-D-glutamate--2,6-diaminopimelate ligase